jgi:hypothetical protein
MLALFGLYSLKFGDCVRLPNGIEIGYEAYVDFSRPYLRPVAVLRTPTGEIIGQEISPIHITDKAAFGSAWVDYNSSRSDFTFIWTTGTGVVKKSEEPELYLRLSEDLGETYYGAPVDMNTNTLWLFNRLSEEERFQSDRCGTSLWTW